MIVDFDKSDKVWNSMHFDGGLFVEANKEEEETKRNLENFSLRVDRRFSSQLFSCGRQNFEGAKYRHIHPSSTRINFGQGKPSQNGLYAGVREGQLYSSHNIVKKLMRRLHFSSHNIVKKLMRGLHFSVR